MKFSEPVLEGQFLKRYKRFFADVQLGGDDPEVVAHVPNTGSLKGCLAENAPCRVTHNDNPARKLKYTLQMIKTPTSWVGVNTGLSNDLVWEAFTSGKVKRWEHWDNGQREVKISDKSRIDLVLWENRDGAPSPTKRLSMADFMTSKFHFVEIKNVSLAEGGRALFPDAVTTRGQKHLEELMELIIQGHSAEIVFTIQREDCLVFSPADDIDPEYGKLLRQAVKQGLVVSAYPCRLEKSGIQLDTGQPLKLEL
ncbi:MAG: DNA/RNA nuclease SfsA [Bdellovibrionaceae bacterium]|nr:DNA/RNA nuclease SfsA [Bdellovibrionales bacterium]MCB9086377.1 DNA/RNA nuclease SfsA [Pseudobdellovibrionaceae bacterium]